MKILHRSLLLLSLFCSLPFEVVATGDVHLGKAKAEIQHNIQHADTMYWMSSSCGGNMRMLEAGLASLDRAEAGLDKLEPEAQRHWQRRIDSLRVDLAEQREMTHDTIAGVLPLAHAFLLRDGLSEWFDDPAVTATVRGTEGIVDTLESNLRAVPQFDVVFSSSVPSTDGNMPRAPDTALENEMAYVLDQNGRFFNRNRMELASVLGDEEMQAFAASGLTGSLASQLCAAWGLDRVLGLRVETLFRDETTWFYLLSGRLFDKEGASVGTVSSFGMALDRRAKQWALVPLFVCPFLLAWVLCGARREELLRCLVASLLGGGITLGLVNYLEALHPSSDVLFMAAWWGPFGLGALLFLVVPAAAFIGTRRLALVNDWFFSSKRSVRAVALGYAAGGSALLGLAALTQYGVGYALALSLLAVPALSLGPLIVLRSMRGNGLGREEVWLASAVCVLVWATILWRVPEADRSTMLFLLGGGAILISGFAGLFFHRLSATIFPLVLILVPTAFGLSLTGRWFWILPFSLLALYYIWRACQSGPRLIAADEGAVVSGEGEEAFELESVLSAPEKMWPFTEVDGYERVHALVREARQGQSDDKVAVITLTGEAGSGKTRILREAFLEAGIPVLHGRCREGDPLGFVEDAFEEAGDQLLQAKETGEVEAMSALTSEVLSMLPGVGLITDFLGGDADEGAGHPGQVAAAVLGYLQDLSDRSGNPVWLWVDDAEHLSPDGCLVLQELLQNALVRKLPIVVVISGRVLESGQFLPAKLKDNPALSLIEAELAWRERDLKACLLQVLSKSCAEEMVQRAGGDGLPVAAYLSWIRSLWLDDKMRLRDGRLELAESVDLGGDVPRDVFGSALSVTKALSEPHYRIVQSAACDGRRFDLRILSEALELPYREVLEALEEAEHLGIVHDHPDNDIFEFNNNIFAEALVDGLRSKGGFRQRYYAMQRALAQAYGQSKHSEHVLEAAHHAILAGKGFECEACGYAIAAAAASERSSEWDQAGRYASFVLERQKMVEACDYWCAGASYLKAKWATGAFLGAAADPASDEQVSALIGALEALEPDAYSEAAILCACELCRILAQRGDDASLSLARRIAPEMSAPSDLHKYGVAGLRTLHVHGLIEYAASRHSDEGALNQARSILEQALAVDFEEDERLVPDHAQMLTTYANVLNALMKTTGDRGLREQVITALNQSIQLKQACGDKLGLAISYGTLGRLYLYDPEAGLADFEQALDAFEKDLEISEALGDVTGLIVMPSSMGKCLLQLGRPDEALAQYKTSLERAERLGQRLSSAFALAGMVQAMCLSDREEDEVETTVDQLLGLLGQMSEGERLPLRGELGEIVRAMKETDGKRWAETIKALAPYSLSKV